MTIGSKLREQLQIRDAAIVDFSLKNPHLSLRALKTFFEVSDETIRQVLLKAGIRRPYPTRESIKLARLHAEGERQRLAAQKAEKP